MTLILAIPTKGPLVFTVDKRLTVGANQYDDTINKLVPIGQAAVGSAFGAVRHVGGNPQQVRFDMYVLMRDFFVNGVYPDFDDLRSDKDIQRFVIHRQAQAIEEVDPDEAIAFSRRFIELCHDTYPLLHVAKEPISKACNVALLKRGGGTRAW